MHDATMVTAFAPASIGNVGVGFDMLGLAMAGVGDRVSVRRSETNGIRILEVRGLDGEIHPYLSTETDHNTASIAAKALWRAHGDTSGLELIVQKGVPLQSGMGSSAASAVAAAVAVNALLTEPMAIEDLLPFALQGEAYASGGAHADNVAPSLIGGLVLCPTVLMPRTIKLPALSGISSVLIHPELQIHTGQSRKNLAKGYSLDQWLAQQGYLAGFIAGCAANDHELIQQSLHDVIIEPQRASTIACFAAVKEAAIRAGVLGASISGSGPSIFALCKDSNAANVAMAMEQACRTFGLECQSFVSPMNAPGAFVEANQ
jgi:homoserine kinase